MGAEIDSMTEITNCGGGGIIDSSLRTPGISTIFDAQSELFSGIIPSTGWVASQLLSFGLEMRTNPNTPNVYDDESASSWPEANMKF